MATPVLVVSEILATQIELGNGQAEEGHWGWGERGGGGK